MPEIEHPEKYDKVPPWKRMKQDPEIKPSPEDDDIDWDLVYDNPGDIILDDLSGAEEG